MISEGFLFLIYFFSMLVGFPAINFSTATSLTQPLAHYSDDPRVLLFHFFLFISDFDKIFHNNWI